MAADFAGKEAVGREDFVRMAFGKEDMTACGRKAFAGRSST
jgi:hypothetical protein